MMLAFVAAAVAAGSDMTVGRWRTETDGGVVEIARCGGSICGRIVSSNKLRTNPGLLDVHNSNAALRGRRLLGLQIPRRLPRRRRRVDWGNDLQCGRRRRLQGDSHADRRRSSQGSRLHRVAAVQITNLDAHPLIQEFRLKGEYSE